MRDSMRIPTPRDDRAKTDHRNILGVVVDVDENQVQTKQGLNTRFCRNQFELCKQNIVSIHDLPQESFKDLPIYNRLSARLPLPRARVTDKASENAVAEGSVQ